VPTLPVDLLLLELAEEELDGELRLNQAINNTNNKTNPKITTHIMIVTNVERRRAFCSAAINSCIIVDVLSVVQGILV